MSAITPTEVDVCAHGAFFDGNDDFGGPPYRFFIAVLVVAPIFYLAGSSAWWLVGTYRRRLAERAAAGPASADVQPSNYQTMNDPVASPQSYPSYSPNPECVGTSLMYDVESASPSSSSGIAPLSTSLLSASEQQAVSDDHTPTVSLHTRFLLFLRSLTRSSPLFMFTVVISSIQFVLTFAALFYGMIAGEQCCMGGTGALYATLCLRLCLAYLNIRVGYWQTNSRNTHIPIADKSCSIGFLIHYIWLSFAFVLIEQGDCSANAPVMYGVSMMNIIFLLINFGILALFSLIQYISRAKSDLMIVLSRTCIKICMIGWCYGGPLDLNDAVTDIEMEIACLPCVTYDQLVTREADRKRRKAQAASKWSNNDCTISIMIEDIRTEEEKLIDNDLLAAAAQSASSSSSSSSSTLVAEEEAETLSCAICLCAYESTDIIRPLPCAHHLHKSCSDSWLKVKSTCPLCVRSVLIH